MLTATKVPVWCTTCNDQPGAAARKLEALAKKGADLEFLLARRLDSEPGKGVVFVAPLSGAGEINAAEEQGFRMPSQICVVRLEGANEPGLGYLVARALAAEHINIRAFSAMAHQNRFIGYLAFDTEADAATAVRLLNAPL